MSDKKPAMLSNRAARRLIESIASGRTGGMRELDDVDWMLVGVVIEQARDAIQLHAKTLQRRADRERDEGLAHFAEGVDYGAGLLDAFMLGLIKGPTRCSPRIQQPTRGTRGRTRPESLN